MAYRRSHRPVGRMSLEELRHESEYIGALIRDVVAVKQKRRSEVEAEITRRSGSGKENSERMQQA